MVIYDNKHVIAGGKNDAHIKLFLQRNKKSINTHIIYTHEHIKSLSCSLDNKYLIIGFVGLVSIFDIKKCQTLRIVPILFGSICNLAFTSDNQNAYICDSMSTLIKMSWELNASSGDDFIFSEPELELHFCIFIIRLINNDKNLLMGSIKGLSVFNFDEKQIIKTFNMNSIVKGIEVINNGINFLVIDYYGDLTIFDLNSLEICYDEKYAFKKGIISKKKDASLLLK